MPRPASARPSDRAVGEEFASALLVRLTQRELARQGLRPDPQDGRRSDVAPAVSATGAPANPARRQAFGPTLGEARVALAPKRALLAGVAARAGYLPLLQVGQGLARLVAECPHDPVLAALVRATDPHDAFARWRRLEGFLHSRHRLEVVGSTATGDGRRGGSDQRHDVRHDALAAHSGVLVVRHVGPPGEPPTPAEDALVLGVMAALCRYVGAQDLAVTLLDADGAELPVLTPAGFREPPAAWCRPGALATWRFAWSSGGGQFDAGDGAREAVATGAHRGRPGTLPGTDAGIEAGLEADARPLASRLAAVIAGDLGRTWTLATAARALDRAGGPSLAPRTLQRRLTAEQATFPGVVRSARVAAAGRLLAESALAVGVVGFVCGFSDQPHFTRQFRRQTGLTPAAYRRAFPVRAR